MADERRVLHPVVADEARDVVRHGQVVVARRVGRFAVVAQVLEAERRLERVTTASVPVGTEVGHLNTYYRVDVALEVTS